MMESLRGTNPIESPLFFCIPSLRAQPRAADPRRSPIGWSNKERRALKANATSDWWVLTNEGVNKWHEKLIELLCLYLNCWCFAPQFSIFSAAWQGYIQNKQLIPRVAHYTPNSTDNWNTFNAFVRLSVARLVFECERSDVWVARLWNPMRESKHLERPVVLLEWRLFNKNKQSHFPSIVTYTRSIGYIYIYIYVVIHDYRK